MLDIDLTLGKATDTMEETKRWGNEREIPGKSKRSNNPEGWTMVRKIADQIKILIDELCRRSRG